MANFLAKFIPSLSEVSEPLRRLTCQDIAWQWNREQEDAFNQIKSAITTAPVLAYINKNKSLVVQSDASQHGLGAVILQENKPIAFASRTLTEAERQYAQIKKELLSVIFAMEKFDQYMYGRHAVIQNDHKPL